MAMAKSRDLASVQTMSDHLDLFLLQWEFGNVYCMVVPRKEMVLFTLLIGVYQALFMNAFLGTTIFYVLYVAFDFAMIVDYLFGYDAAERNLLDHMQS